MIRPYCIVALVGLLCVWNSTAAFAAADPPFQLVGDRLIVTTDKLELVLQQGTVVSLQDRATGEYLSKGDGGDGVRHVPTGASVEKDAWSFRQAWYKGGPKQCAADEKLQAVRRRPMPGVPPTLKRVSATEADVIYTQLIGGRDGDEIRYRVAIDGDTQEVLLTGEVRLADLETPPLTLDLSFLHLKCSAVILGCGTRIAADMPGRRIDYCTRKSNNLYSPSVAVLEGRRSVAAFFPESHTANVNVYLAHAPDADDVAVFTTGTDPRHEKAVIGSVPLRVGIYSTWVAAARRYRERFEAITGAKPLWEQTPTWVRRIHAVHTDAPGGAHGDPKPEEADDYYRRLAELIPPETLLLFYWNGNGIVVGADPRYMTRLGWPKPHVIKALKDHGFHWMGYHHYTLLFPPHAIQQRYQDIERNNWGLPEGYVFTPDYDGPPEKFHDHFRPVSTGYYKPMDEARLWVFHPGSKRGREFFVRNFGNYCKFHNADGAYLDICGCGSDHHFPPEKKVLGGMTYQMGEDRMLREAKQQLPELAMMSEVESPWSVAHAFYTWEGASHYTHARTYQSNDSIVNHPLRAALWGSYCWTRESVLQPHESALMGALPELHLEDPWSIARCRLFAQEELFHDLPSTWDAEALAYFRAEGGRWFQFRRLPYGDGYVELTGDRPQVRLGRFSGVSESPLKRPAWIPRWQAYRDDKPIGLNPARCYPFIMRTPQSVSRDRVRRPSKAVDPAIATALEGRRTTQGGPPADFGTRSQQEGDYCVTALPADVFVRAFRNDAKSWSTVEFGTPAGGPRKGDVTISFRRKCLRVCDAGGEHAGPFQAGSRATFSTRMPGGLVLVWEEPTARRGHRRNAFLAAYGRLDSLGAHDPRWCYLSHFREVTRRIGDTELAAIEVGSGRHRGYAESWVTLDAKGNPVLRFQVGYPKPEQKQNRAIRPHDFTVLVNGREVWRETVGSGDKWLDRQVPLAEFKGRTVLLTLSVEEQTQQDVGPSHLDPPSLFGNVYVDGNPISFGPLDGSALPRPAKVLWTDFFAAKTIDTAWTVVNSPANQKKNWAPRVENGMLSLAGSHYKHQYLTRPLPEPNPVVQARLQMGLTGCSAAWNAGIGLYWAKGVYGFMTVGGHREDNLAFHIRGVGRATIPLEERAMRLLDDNACDCWVRIEVGPETIRYASSLDGKTWHAEKEVPRPKTMNGPPQLLIVGRGEEGDGPLFQNDRPHDSSLIPARIGELIVGGCKSPE